MSAAPELLAHTEFERLVWLKDRPSGMRAVVAIHDRTLGPARGGTRLAPYADASAAAADALRLAAAMTRKFAVHGLPYGGGKAVLLRDAGWDDPAIARQRLEAYGRALGELGVDFMTGPDVGIGEAELAVLRGVCDRIAPTADHAVASAATAAGVRACLEEALGGVAGARIAVQGVGATGGALARQLAARGAELILADVDRARAEAVALELGATLADPDRVLEAAVDALAPCALGPLFDRAVIARLRCRVVAGSANAQLFLPAQEHAAALAARGVIFVPGFLANGGAAVAILQPQGNAHATVDHAEAAVRAAYRQVAARAEGGDLWRAAEALARARLAAVASPETPC